MQTLNDISSENVRKNWDTYKDSVRNTSYYDVLWKNLIDKFDIDESGTYFSILKKFIDDEEIDCESLAITKIFVEKPDNDTIILKRLDGSLRLYVHLLCDKIGLHHQSKSNSHHSRKNNRDLYIYKPTIWLWEYTKENPYSKPSSRHYCIVCGKNGSETELFRCASIYGTYCSDCIDTTSDGEGHDLCDFKFEYI